MDGWKYVISDNDLKFSIHSWCLRNIGLDWRRKWHPTPVLLPRKSHGRRSLVGYNPWGREELDMTEQLYFHFSLSCIGKGNGNPLQCSCLENPRDREVWWAAVHGIAQSRTRLKQLSSSKSSSVGLDLAFLYQQWQLQLLLESKYFKLFMK